MKKNHIYILSLGLISLINLLGIIFLKNQVNWILGGGTALSLSLILWILFSEKSQKEGTENNPLTESLESLYVALSSFSSGDMTKKALNALENLDSTQTADPTQQVLMDLINRNIQEFNSITDEPTGRLCFTGNNGYQEGQLIGEKIAKEINGKGRVVISIPTMEQVLHFQRAKGCANYLIENYKGIQCEIMYRGEEGDDSQDRLLRMDRRIKEKGEFDAIYLTDGAGEAMLEIMKKLNKQGMAKFYQHDIAGDTINNVKTGRVETLLAESFYVETYNSVIYIYNNLETGWEPLSKKIYMEPLVVTKENCHEFWDFTKDERIITDMEHNLMVEPQVRIKQTKWKIAIILPIGKDSWFDLGYRGAAKAKEKLAPLGVEVDIIDAFEGYHNFGQYSRFNPLIEDIVKQNYHGLSTCIFDPKIAESIKRANKAGLTVTTYNNEPINFREIISNVAMNINTLRNHSSQLASAAEESSRANTQINGYMTSIEESSEIQDNKLNETEKNVASLSENIDDVNKVLANYVQSVNSLNDEAQKGEVSVEESERTSEDLSQSISSINESLASLDKKMEDIRQIIETIDTFSSDTNVLAINASIQAARAGSKGNSFAIIAANIRKLSEQSSHATELIRSQIDDMSANMKEVLHKSNQNINLVRINNTKVNEAGQSFHSIAQYIDQGNQEVHKINSALTGVLSFSRNIKEAMDKVKEMNGRNTHSIQEITVAINELSSQSVDLSSTAQKLLDMARDQGEVFTQLTFEKE